MEETQKIFEPARVEGEETLVTASDASLSTPRFDEVEAQVARPVVPLSGSSVKRSVVGGVRRRQWPIALVLISALAGGVVSLLAFRLYQQRQQTQAVAATQADGTETTDAAQTPEPTPLAQTAATETQAQSEAPVVFEEFDPAKESLVTAGGSSSGDAGATRKATDANAKPAPAGKEERRDETTKPTAPRANAEPRPRLVETIPAAPRQVSARGENVSRDERRGGDDDAFEDRRERRRERREQRRRGRGRNIDRIKDIFEGPPPA